MNSQNSQNSPSASKSYKVVSSTPQNDPFYGCVEIIHDAYTDENGLRKVGDYYCVAFGTGISNGIGSKFKVTFDNGNEILVIVADHKADRHTDKTNTYMNINDKANVIEFIVDSNKLNNTAKVMGNVNYISGFEGQIIYIEEVNE